MASIKIELIDETIPDEGEGHDEVDFVQTPKKLDMCLSCRQFNQTGITICDKLNNNCTNRKVGIFGDTQVKTHEKFNFFHFPRRQKSDPGAYAMGDNKKKRSRFVRSASLAKIFGSTYNTKKYEDGSALLKLQTIKKNFLNLEKFHKKPESNQSQNQAEETDEIKINDEDYIYEHEPSAKSFRTLTRGLGKLLRRNCSSVDISAPDPEYKVSYLGNVLTGWAKGGWKIINF